VRNEIERIDPTVDMESIDKFIHALKIIDSNDNFTNIKQEDLPRLFVELDLPIGGHDIRKKITDRKIKLESTKPIAFDQVISLFNEIKKEKEEEDGKMDFRSMLSKAKNLVKVKKRKNKTKLADVKEDISTDLLESSKILEKGSKTVTQEVQISENTIGTQIPIPAQRFVRPQNHSNSSQESTISDLPELAKENLEIEHHYSISERVSFSNWINDQLKTDTLSKPYLPIDPNCESDLFEKLSDGIVFCRMLQLVSPDLINQRAINKTIKHQFHKIENQNLVLNTATSIGCVVVNQDVTGLIDEVPYLQLGLLWQIIRAGLFSDIQVNKSPEIFECLKSILADDENLSNLHAMSPEEILLRWVNYHLEQNDNYKGNPISNFGNDIKDSTAYQHLLQQLFKHDKIDLNSVKMNCNSEKNFISRATVSLKMADKLGCKAFVTERDIVNGNVKLNTAFVANLFNKKMFLSPPAKSEEEEDKSEGNPEDEEDYTETAEEKTYRHFINSLDIKPQINCLYIDLRDGVAILKLEDRIKPGVVEWKRRVNFPPFKTPFQGGENCVYALDIAEKRISNINVGRGQVRGHDIHVGKPKQLTLGLVWQLMRAYTLSLLAKLSNSEKDVGEKDVLSWVNQKTGYDLKSFKDPEIKKGDIIRETLLAIDPNAEIDEKTNSSDCLENAQYLISIARKMGAIVYTLPEDVVNLNPKMILCLFVTLMILDSSKKSGLTRSQSIRVLNKPKIPKKPASLKNREKTLPPIPAENITNDFTELHDILSELSKETSDLLK